MSADMILLHLLAAVSTGEPAAAALARIGLDDLSARLAFDEARRIGFVTPAGKVPAVTAAGRAWAEETLAPLRALLPSDPQGAEHRRRRQATAA